MYVGYAGQVSDVRSSSWKRKDVVVEPRHPRLLALCPCVLCHVAVVGMQQKMLQERRKVRFGDQAISPREQRPRSSRERA